MPATTSTALSKAEVLRFQDEGYLGPFELCTPEEMATIRERINREVLTTEGPCKDSNPTGQCRHLDCRVVYDLCSHPAIVDRMAAIYGPDLMLWRSNFFIKNPGDKEIPWHQDGNYWPIEPAINISAWLAIDESTVENSCVQLIPGTHRKTIAHIKSTPEMVFAEMADPVRYDASKAINMELKPGQFFLFNERTLHHSFPNRSNKRRLGLAVRVTVPFVRVYYEGGRLFPAHKNIMLCGEDRMGFNRMTTPPEN
jgi:ectoine hydroxylase-related dioxygenase (phytanoyl-CoA dioxygenase family)